MKPIFKNRKCNLVSHLRKWGLDMLLEKGVSYVACFSYSELKIL